MERGATKTPTQLSNLYSEKPKPIMANQNPRQLDIDRHKSYYFISYFMLDFCQF